MFCGLNTSIHNIMYPIDTVNDKGENYRSLHARNLDEPYRTYLSRTKP
jgi:hypothetical protein